MGSALASSATRADTDDMKWVARCLKDNADCGAAVEVVTNYCACMNNKMSGDETQSISAWGKKTMSPSKKFAIKKPLEIII
jgi:hypothetical protein